MLQILNSFDKCTQMVRLEPEFGMFSLCKVFLLIFFYLYSLLELFGRIWKSQFLTIIILLILSEFSIIKLLWTFTNEVWGILILVINFAFLILKIETSLISKNKDWISITYWLLFSGRIWNHRYMFDASTPIALINLCVFRILRVNNYRTLLIPISVAVTAICV